jgi:hypothetical protein
VASHPPKTGLNVVRVESTPNPNAMKFVLNRPVTRSTVSARSPDEAVGNPITAALFSIPGITGVMVLGDFVAINKSPGASWPDIKNAVQQNLILLLSSFNLENR